MAKKSVRRLIFYSGLILGYAAAVGILLVFFYNMDHRNNIIAEYELERTAFTLLELFRESWLPENLTEIENLRGFGIYSDTGSGILTWGSAPPALTARHIGRLPMQNNYRSFQRRQDESLQLTMRIHHMPGNPGPMRRMMSRMANAPTYLFLDQENSQYWQTSRYSRNARILIPALLLLFLVLIIVLYKKNRDYRQRLGAQQELVRLGEISRTLSHEIKNPLSAIRIQTGILKKTAATGAEVPQELRIIEEEVDRLGMLTRRISDFVKDPLGQPQKIHLESFLTALIRRFDFRISLQNTTGHDITVQADKDRLRSVLENIIKNGMESYPSPAVEGTDVSSGLEIELRQIPEGTVIAVLDRGAGIDPGIRDKIFEPSYSSKLAGSGIGLAIAQRFIEVLKGKIVIQPRRGGGTEVHIIFRKV